MTVRCCFTHGPLEKLAGGNGFPDVLPAACEVDYITTALSRGVLHRDLYPGSFEAPLKKAGSL